MAGKIQLINIYNPSWYNWEVLLLLWIAFSPLILGYLKPEFGLSFGISVLSEVWISCGLLLIKAAKFIYMTDHLKIISAGSENNPSERK